MIRSVLRRPRVEQRESNRGQPRMFDLILKHCVGVCREYDDAESEFVTYVASGLSVEGQLTRSYLADSAGNLRKNQPIANVDAELVAGASS